MSQHKKMPWHSLTKNSGDRATSSFHEMPLHFSAFNLQRPSKQKQGLLGNFWSSKSLILSISFLMSKRPALFFLKSLGTPSTSSAGWLGLSVTFFFCFFLHAFGGACSPSSALSVAAAFAFWSFFFFLVCVFFTLACFALSQRFFVFVLRPLFLRSMCATPPIVLKGFSTSGSGSGNHRAMESRSAQVCAENAVSSTCNPESKDLVVAQSSTATKLIGRTMVATDVSKQRHTLGATYMVASSSDWGTMWTTLIARQCCMSIGDDTTRGFLLCFHTVSVSPTCAFRTNLPPAFSQARKMTTFPYSILFGIVIPTPFPRIASLAKSIHFWSRPLRVWKTWSFSIAAISAIFLSLYLRRSAGNVATKSGTLPQKHQA